MTKDKVLFLLSILVALIGMMFAYNAVAYLGMNDFASSLMNAGGIGLCWLALEIGKRRLGP